MTLFLAVASVLVVSVFAWWAFYWTPRRWFRRTLKHIRSLPSRADHPSDHALKRRRR